MSGEAIVHLPAWLRDLVGGAFLAVFIAVMVML